MRHAQLMQFNKILVVGDAEVAAGTVNTRERDGTVLGEQALDVFAQQCQDEIAQFK